MAIILRMWRVQVTLSGVTIDGWESSRQTPTMTVAARDSSGAVKSVADLAVAFTPRAYLPGRKVAMAHVVEVAKDGSPIGDPVWVRVTYTVYGTEIVSAATYDAIKRIEDYNPDNE